MNWRVVRVLVLLGLLMMLVQGASAAWWNESWNYKVDSMVYSADFPYQMNLTVHSTSGTNNATDIFLGGKNATNFDDIRPTLDNTTLLAYWIEDNTSDPIKAHVNVTANGTVNIYYNASGVKSISSIADTFPFGDDCSGDKSNWTGDTSYLSISGGVCTFDATTTTARQIYSAASFDVDDPYIVETRINRVSGADIISAFGPRNSANTQGGYLYEDWGPSNNMRFKKDGGARQDIGAEIVTGSWTIERIEMISTSEVRWYYNDIEGTNSPYTTTANIPDVAIPIHYQAYGSAAHQIDWVFKQKYTSDPPIWGVWSSEQSINSSIIAWSNNITNNQTLNFNILSGTYVQFNITLSNNSNNYYNWSVAGSDKGVNSTTFDWTFDNGGSFEVIGSATYTADNLTINKTWNVTVLEYLLTPASPANNSNQNTTLTLSAREWPSDPSYTWYVSTDNQFINIIQQGSGSVDNETITGSVTGLYEGITYYWRFKNNSGGYSDVWQFTTNTTAATPGRLNITARDEKTNAEMSSFNVTLYNNTAVLSKLSTAGWANFSASEVTSNEYLVRVDAADHAPRNVLVTSPANLTVYLPNSTDNTINTLAFYLVDTTGKFPWSGSIMTISKNSSTMVSSYFDADAKVTAYLIQGDSYKITISYNNNIQEWGNYIPISSGNVEMMLTNIAINETELMPFVYNFTYDTSGITLEWSDAGGALSSLNYTIYKGAARTQVHQLITSVDHGQSTYIITNTSDIYYISFSANTTHGDRMRMFAYDPRAGTQRTDQGKKSVWSYGGFTVPDWVYTVVAIIAIIALAAGFGAIHAELGAIISIVMTILFMYWGILRGPGATIGFFGGLGVVTVLYFMRSKDTTAPVMMAYRIAMFMIFFNFAVMLINGSGIIPGTYVDVYGNACVGADASSGGCILARISSLAPYEAAADGAGMWQQISFVLITATAFGLIVLTLQYMLGLFWFGLGISQVYLAQLPLDWEWRLVLHVGLLIIFVTGFMQYKAATSLRDKE